MGRKIALVGFAVSRTEAPYNDPSWEIWGVNDLYAYVPRVDVTFELHHLRNLGNRRNPGYEQWFQNGCPSGGKQTPIFMCDPQPGWPTAQRFPFEHVRAMFNTMHDTDYWTSSIAWMIGMAIAELSQEARAVDEAGNERTLRVANPGAELALWGIDMAADSEYSSQRPAVEYYVGIARGMGIPVFIAGSSDICKSTAVYGIGTTAPLAIKARANIEHLTQSKVALMQQEQALQSQQLQLQYQKGQIEGAREVWKNIERVWTQPTDIETGQVLEPKDRGAPMADAPLAASLPALPVPLTDGQPVGVGGS